MGSSDVIAMVLVAAKVLTAMAGCIFIVSGLDDCFIDLCYASRALYRRLFIIPRFSRLTEDQLRTCTEQPVAVMIPAWDESAVIRSMLANTRRALSYSRYVIFVGIYRNDPATAREVELLLPEGPRVVRVTVPHDGPTNKADCLNWIYQGIQRYEGDHGIEFQVYVMQDCEDVIHPLCYRLFNYLMPRYDMVQLPVLSLERKWYEFTGGHYLDEFAQLHYKDLVVREMINHSLPAAGVGVAFSRRALAAAALASHNEVFRVDSLTEDYDFGFRLKRLGMRQIFVRYAVERNVPVRDLGSGKTRFRRLREFVGVREYFPSTLRTAVRQKSRWVIGIAFQGWAHLRWAGDWRTKYMLYRDRKAIVTNLATILGYVIVAIVSTIWTVQWLAPENYRFPPLVERGSTLWFLMLATLALLLHRLFMRVYCVYRLYGSWQAALSAPRMLWGNVVNFGATVRAIRIYLRFLRTGKPITWDKTGHSFPAMEEIPSFRQHLGDVLLHRGFITLAQLNAALELQGQRSSPLGELLIEMGALNRECLEFALQVE
jgi:bacteriophage N4 adsorption protein B